jgi:DNA-binding NarL/FixJ family response regulator
MVSALLASLLKRQADFEVRPGVVNCDLLLRAVQDVSSGVALVSADLQDGPLSGLATLPKIRELNPKLRTVLVLNRSQADLVVEALRAGARGIFSRANFQPTTLVRCVHRVYEGQIWVNTDEMEDVVGALSQTYKRPLLNSLGANLLSRREEEVMSQVADGLSNRDIAQKLRISEHTVKNYMFHIFDKLGVSNRVELVLYAMSKRGNILPASEQKRVSSRRIDGTVGEP